MHRADIVLIGPLGPLLPHVWRIRLWPLVAGVALVCVSVLAGLAFALRAGMLPDPLSAALMTALPQQTMEHAAGSATPIQLTSRPTGATILLRNRELGHTPASVSAAPGDLLTLRRDGFLDAFVRASSLSLEVPLWHAQPDVRLVRPPVPGASIRSADFLPDGRVALAIEVPPTGERQAWAYDPTDARLDRLGHADAPGALPIAVAIAPDGTHTAAILRLNGLDGAAADQLTLDGPEGPQQPLASFAVGERLLDLSWSPVADGVLVLSQRPVAGGTGFVLRFVAASGEVRDMADLPGEPVTGSWAWAPDGHVVAFLVHTSTTALVALDTRSGELRYLDDLQADTLPSSGAVAPATWKSSGDLLFAAPAGSGGFPSSASNSAPVLFQVAPGRVDAHRVGDVEPVWAPIVREDGLVLTLARGENDVLVLRPVDDAGHALAEQRLGVQVSGAYAARWDLGHRQLLIVRGASGNGVEVLLLRFGGDDLPSTPDRHGGTESSTPGASQ